MEYCEDGTIAEVAKLGLPESLIRVYTYQIIKAVDFLHQNGIIHRDIKGTLILTMLFSDTFINGYNIYINIYGHILYWTYYIGCNICIMNIMDIISILTVYEYMIY